MDNTKLPVYSFIEWTALKENMYTIYNRDAIFRAIYNATGETMLFGGFLDPTHNTGPRIAISSGGGMSLTNLSNIEYCLVVKIHPFPPTKDPSTFTKLELSSLMIAQGMSSCDEWFSGKYPFSHISKSSVELAKAVLEEANK